MKKCAHCKELKPLDDYAYSNRILKTRQKHCRDCMRKFNKESYLRRSKEKKQQTKENKQIRIEENQQWVWDYLSSHPCVECGESNPVVLEFDHVRGNKTRAVSDLARLGYSIIAIQKEIGKCQVLCANCHRKKTHEERGWFRGN